ncbi:MAG: sensor histidine kinase, partial [Chloroflexi bacterium]
MLFGIRWGSLRAKIIAWSFVPTAMILVAVALVTLYAYQQVTEDLVVERDRELIRLSAGQVTNQLFEHTATLADVARLLAVHQDDLAAQQAALREAHNRLLAFDGGVLVLDNRGRVVAAEPSRLEILGEDWSDRLYFRHILRASETVVSDIVPDGPGGAEVIVAAVPVMGDQGEFLGAVAGMFRLGAGALSVFYGDIIKLRIGGTGATYVVDGNGRVIYHTHLDLVGNDFSQQPVVQEALAGKVGAVRTRDFDGREIVAGFAPVPGTSWGLVAEESWAALNATSRGYRQFLLVLLALGVLLPALVVSVGVRRITGPIIALMDAAQEMAAGHFGRRITARTGDEVESLAEQFNFMAAQLDAMMRALEQRVVDLEHARAALRASRDQLQAILEGVADGIVAYSAGGEIVYANTEAARVMGYPSVEALVRTQTAEILRKFDLRDEAGRPFPLDRLPGRLARQGL